MKARALAPPNLADLAPPLHLDVTFGDRRRRDIQNLFGSVCDSLNGVVYDDDHQITKVSGSKVYKKGHWEYTITITTLKHTEETPWLEQLD